jgi:FtsZ-binding cell division protein ZapB
MSDPTLDELIATEEYLNDDGGGHCVTDFRADGTPKLTDAEIDELQEKCRKLERERDEAIKAISAFCEASQWCAKEWKEQDHIKPLFDIYNNATTAKGEHCTCGQGFNPDCPSEAHHKAKEEVQSVGGAEWEGNK